MLVQVNSIHRTEFAVRDLRSSSNTVLMVEAMMKAYFMSRRLRTTLRFDRVRTDRSWRFFVASIWASNGKRYAIDRLGVLEEVRMCVCCGLKPFSKRTSRVGSSWSDRPGEGKPS